MVFNYYGSSWTFNISNKNIGEKDERERKGKGVSENE